MGDVGFFASPEPAFLSSLGVSPVAEVGVTVVVEAILPAMVECISHVIKLACRVGTEPADQALSRRFRRWVTTVCM